MSRSEPLKSSLQSSQVFVSQRADGGFSLALGEDISELALWYGEEAAVDDGGWETLGVGSESSSRFSPPL